MNLIKKMFSLSWLITTILVFAGTALCVRLGIWQLDRLAQRRVFNAQYESMRAASQLNLNENVPTDIESMEWRAVTVSGEYDFENQIAIRNQYHDNIYGYHLITPLLFNGMAVFVDRGFIPAEGNSAPADWRKFDESGTVTVIGQIRLGQGKPAIGGVADALPAAGEKLNLWNNLDIVNISPQMPYPILIIYVQPNVDPTDDAYPIPYQPEVEISEGPHMGYALQWFAFATILFVGYPFYLKRQE